QKIEWTMRECRVAHRDPAALIRRRVRAEERRGERSCASSPGEGPVEPMAVVIDRLFSEPQLAELYDAFCAGGGTRPHPAGRQDFLFYQPIVMSHASVLDVGCGTGELLRRARESGHGGRLCGLDPAEAMLDVARRRADIVWVLGDPISVH